jgi:hypothetical protein
MAMSTDRIPGKRALFLSLCDRVPEGTILLDEFYEQWPCNEESTEFKKSLYEDLEEGVQHFPGHLLTSKPDRPTGNDLLLIGK